MLIEKMNEIKNSLRSYQNLPPLVRLTDEKGKKILLQTLKDSGETDNVLERCTLPKLTLEKAGDLNEPMRRMWLNSSINYPQRKNNSSGFFANTNLTE